MDDGAQTAEESAEMLETLYDDGVDVVVLTPHFYRFRNDINEFLARRDASFKTLNAVLYGNDRVPELIMGCECYYYRELFQEDFSSLCIGETGFLLLELPFEKFSKYSLSQLRHSILKSGSGVILAHIERYLGFYESDVITDFARDCGALCQMNCDSLMGASLLSRKKLLRLIDDGIVQLLGTDAHNLKERPPCFGEAERIIKKYNPALFGNILMASESVIKRRPNRPKEKI
jgi:protein-tyrosine phosphatase